MVTVAIVNAIRRALEQSGVNGIDVTLEHPADPSHGDYSTNVALVAAKSAKQIPKVLAEKIAASIEPIEGVEKIEVAGAGFINFHFTRDTLRKATSRILSARSSWGKNEKQKGERAMYEYTDPNPFKVFHIGHLMSNAIGESLSRIAVFNGVEVVRANYQGDIGPHVAKCIWGLRKENLSPAKISDMGKAYVLGNNAYEDSPDAKAEIDSINKALYQKSNPELNALYETGRKTSLEHFEDLYKILGTKFNHYFFESVVGPIGVEIVKEAQKRGVFEESDGAVVYKGEKKGLHTRVFITKMGTPTYEAKDLGLNKVRFEKEQLDYSVIMTASEQSEYFKVVLAAMAEVLPEVAKRTRHQAHGFMKLVGGKMSSRKGNIVTGESIIHEMRALALEKMQTRELTDDEKHSIADAVAVAAIKYSILKQGAGKDIVFDPELSLSFEGDSGPYLQYSYVRALSILKKAESEKIAKYHTDASVPDAVTELERLLYRFPEVVERAQEEFEPHHITTFLTEIAGVFNSWYANEKIVDSTDEFSPYKVALVEAFKTTMENGLWLLGIRAPQKM